MSLCYVFLLIFGLLPLSSAFSPSVSFSLSIPPHLFPWSLPSISPFSFASPLHLTFYFPPLSPILSISPTIQCEISDCCDNPDCRLYKIYHDNSEMVVTVEAKVALIITTTTSNRIPFVKNSKSHFLSLALDGCLSKAVYCIQLSLPVFPHQVVQRDIFHSILR